MVNKKINNVTQAIDLISIILGAFFLLLIILFSYKIEEWIDLSLTTIIYLIGYTVSCRVLNQIKNEKINLVIQTSVILFLFSYYFQLAGKLQHIFFNGWFDNTLISLDQLLIGTEATHLMEGITNPVLTEWMMFSYTAYIPLLITVSFICYFSAGIYSSREYLFNLILTYSICYLGFIIFPVASPLYHYSEAYSVQLNGGFFALCGELIRKYAHFPGGSLPSPHCAATTIMVLFLFKHNRKIFYWLLPVFITIYFSTVYGRYHYSWDAVTGLITALAVVKVSPKILQYLTLIFEQKFFSDVKEIKTVSAFRGGLE